MSLNESFNANISKEGDNMAGRRGQPIDILVAKGKKHLTHEEKKRRKEGEIKLGQNKFICPEFILKDPKAFEKWQEIMELYKDVDFVSNGDTGHLARYCKTFSEYYELLDAYQRVSEIHYDCGELQELIEDTNDKGKYLYSYKVQKALKDLFSINAILTIETAINKKMDMLIKMEDRLFLNPLAKVRNVPKKPGEKKDPLKEQGFGNV
jgi:phage terminase small subunit